MVRKQVYETMQAMPLEEKVAQLQGIWLTDLLDGTTLSEEKCRALIPHGIGHVCQFGVSTTMLPDELSRVMHALQLYVQANTKARIPILFHEEAITGAAVRGATITPQMIGMSCSWNPQLVYDNARMSAINLKKLGSYYALSPVMDVIEDARWGRGEEGFGEDARLVAHFGLSFIQGLQSEGVGATAKHFAGYGVVNQETTFFMNETLYPFEVAVRAGNVKAIMPGYHLFHGVPCTASGELLQHYLRTFLVFDGLIVSDYGAIVNTLNTYGYTKSEYEAAVACLQAGVDTDFPSGGCYAHLIDAVKKGDVSEAAIDASVERVLSLKGELGQLEYARHSAPTDLDLDPPHFRKQALASAREAVVLLKNEGTLPISEDTKRIAVVGPNADSYYSLLGDYTWGGIAEFFHGNPADRLHPRLVTLMDGLRAVAPKDIEIVYERGCDWVDAQPALSGTQGGDERAKHANYRVLEPIPPTDYKRAVALANDSDIVIAAMGENRFLCGECCDRENVCLPGAQEAFVHALCDTGKPVVLVVFGGRPMAISVLAERCAAVLYGWYPGEEGGTAVAEILMGYVNPSAKLTVTLPDSSDDVPVHYTKVMPPVRSPRFPFGHGLSYTQFEYGVLAVPGKVSTEADFFEISFQLKNTGVLDGVEVAQVYYRSKTGDSYGNRKLLGYVRESLPTDSSVQCRLKVPLELFSHYEADSTLWIEPAEYMLELGASSGRIYQTAAVRIVGKRAKLSKRRIFFATQCGQ